MATLLRNHKKGPVITLNKYLLFGKKIIKIKINVVIHDVTRRETAPFSTRWQKIHLSHQIVG